MTTPIELKLDIEAATILMRTIEHMSRQHIKVITDDSLPAVQLKVASRELKVLNDIEISLETQVENYHDLNRQPNG